MTLEGRWKPSDGALVVLKSGWKRLVNDLADLEALQE